MRGVVGCISISTALLLLQSHTWPCRAASSASSSSAALPLSSADISSNPLTRTSLEENIHIDGHHVDGDDVDNGSQSLNVIMPGINGNRPRGLQAQAHAHVLGVKRSLPTALPSPVSMSVSIPKHNVNSLSFRGGFTPSPRRHLRSTDMNLSSNPPPNGENGNDKNNNDKNEKEEETETESGSKHENKKNNKSRNANNNSNAKNRKELSKRMPNFPIQPSELPQFLSLSLMMFLFIYIYTTARDTKDTLIVSNCGAEAIPFLKLYGVMPSALLFFMGYSKAVEYFGRSRQSFKYGDATATGTSANVSDAGLGQRRLFTAIMMLFLGFYGLFAFWLYPNRNMLHWTDANVNAVTATAGSGILGRVVLPMDSAPMKLIRYWSFSLYFIVSELWASAGVPLLFWQVRCVSLHCILYKWGS